MPNTKGSRVWKTTYVDFLKEKLNININPNIDFYFFPFFAAMGFTNRSSRIVATEQIFNSVLTGRKSVILKWLNSEGKLKNDENQILRDVKIGDYFIGKLLNSNYAQSFETLETGFSNVDGQNVNFVEQTSRKRFTVITNANFFYVADENELLDTRILNLFWYAPELSKNDVLVIETAEVVRNKEDNSIAFLKLNFVSLQDKLKKVNRILSNLVNFAEPGGWAPLPEVRGAQANNQTLFFDNTQAENNAEKRIYIQSPYIQNGITGVKSIQIEFNGLFGLIGIDIFGRVFQRDLLSFSEQPKKLFVHNLNMGNGQNPLSYTDATENQLSVVAGKVQHLNWFSDWKSEYGYYFDPVKSRNSAGVLELTQIDNTFERYDFAIGDNQQKDFVLHGKNNLRWNPFYLFNPTPTIKINENKPTFPENKLLIKGDLSTFLNMNSMLQFANSKLEYQGVKKSNFKSLMRTVLNSVASSASIAGSSTDFKPIGVFAGFGRKLLNVFFQFLPTAWFDSTNTYTEYVSDTSMLLPTNFIKHVQEKTGRDNLIPIELFNQSRNNFLGGLANSKMFNYSFNFELTDLFKNGSNNIYNTSVFRNPSSNFFFNENEKIETLTSNDGFVIDAINVTGLGKVPYRINFYDEGGHLIWQQTRTPQAQLSGNLLEIKNYDLFSDYDENDLSDAFRYRIWTQKTPNPVFDINSDNSDAARRLRAIDWIENKNSIVIPYREDEWEFNFAAKTVTEHELIETNLWNYYFDEWTLNRNIVSFTNFDTQTQIFIRDYFEKNPNASNISQAEQNERVNWKPTIAQIKSFFGRGGLNIWRVSLTGKMVRHDEVFVLPNVFYEIGNKQLLAENSILHAHDEIVRKWHTTSGSTGGRVRIYSYYIQTRHSIYASANSNVEFATSENELSLMMRVNLNLNLSGALYYRRGRPGERSTYEPFNIVTLQPLVKITEISILKS